MPEGQAKGIAELALEQQLESQALRQREQKRIALRDQLVRLLDPFVPALLGALGFLVFLLIWEAIHRSIEQIPSPAFTFAAAVKLFADPFYSNGPNDQGIGWNILSSLRRVGLGFGLAAAIGIPVGFLIGRFRLFHAMTSPIISLLRPVSPLAWLPIGLLLFKAANPAAIWCIFICSIWPMVMEIMRLCP